MISERVEENEFSDLIEVPCARSSTSCCVIHD